MQSEELEALRRRWQREGTPQISLKLAEEYRRSGRVEEAIIVLQEGLRTHPHHVSAQVAMGRFCLELGQSERAREVLEAVVERDPTHLVANKLLVKVHNDLGNPQRARDRLDLYVLLNDGDPEVEELERVLEAGEEARRREEATSPDESFAGLEDQAPAAARVVAVPEPAPAEPELAAADQEPAAGTLPAVPAGVQAAPQRDLFSSLWEDDAESRYWESVSSEGIFSLAPPAAPAVAPPTTEGAPPEELPAPPAALEEPPAPSGAREPASATLGELYREQGHTREAEEIFRTILDKQPEHAAAREGLARISPAGGEPLTAAELLGAQGLPSGASVGERRRAVLEGYLERLRAGRNRHV